MFILLILCVPVIWFVLIYVFDKANIEVIGDDYAVAKFFSGALLVITILAMLITNLVCISEQKSRYIDLITLQGKKEVYQAKAIVMTQQYKEVLIKSYPSYEKSVFDGLTPNDVKMLFIKYPEIKASITMVSYAEKIQALNDDIYAMDLMVLDNINSIRFAFVNPWIFNSLMPNIPKELKNIVK